MIITRSGFSIRGKPPLINYNIEPVFNAATDRNLLSSVSLDGTFASTSNWILGASGGGTSGFLAAGTGKDGGATKALQLTWDGAADASASLENPDWIAATRMVCTFWIKSTSILTDTADNSGIKHCLFRTDPGSGDVPYGRITWGLTTLTNLCSGLISGSADGGVNFTTCSQLDGGGIIQNIDKSIGWSNNITPRATSVNDGTWHRITHYADTNLKFMKIFLDGIRVLDSTGLTPNIPSPGYKGIQMGVTSPAVISPTTILYSNFTVFDRGF